MFRGYRFLFWGYFAVIFRINLFGIPILPVFAGYLIAMSGIRQIAEGVGRPACRSVQLFYQAKTCCGLLAALSFLTGVMPFLFVAANTAGSLVELIVLGLTVLSGSVQLILGCLLLEGSAALLSEFGQVEQAVQYEGKATIFIVLQTAAVLAQIAAYVWNSEAASVVGALLGLVITIWLLILWGEMKRAVEPYETEMIKI